MPLSQSQYQAIMREYEEIRRRHRAEQSAHLEEVYAKLPRYRELDLLIPTVGAALGAAKITGDDEKAADLASRFHDASDEKRRLLEANGYPADFVDLHYDCDICHDTGYDGNVRCKCLIRKVSALAYEQSHLSALIRTNKFSLMRDDYYEGDDLHRFHAAVDICKQFIDTFGTPDQPAGLLFFGSVGSGKSFLTIATAEKCLANGAQVLYFSAVGLFDRMSRAAFHQEESDVPETFFTDLTEADLLVIDDLGTELTNAFVSSRLFQLINDRAQSGRATIISTNFDLEELRARYSDRVFSRLFSLYKVCELTGPDIRLLQKTM